MTEKRYKAVIRKKDREIERLKRAAKKEKEYPSAPERVAASKGYFGYLMITAKSTAAYGIMKRISAALKKYTALSRIIKTVAAVVTFLQTSAAAVVFLGVMAIFLPAAGIVGALLFVISLFSYGRVDKKMKTVEGDAYVFAFTKQTGIIGATAGELLRRGAVFYLTSSFSLCGFSGARARRDGTFYLHVGYFFRMKRLFEKNGVKIYFIV